MTGMVYFEFDNVVASLEVSKDVSSQTLEGNVRELFSIGNDMLLRCYNRYGTVIHLSGDMDAFSQEEPCHIEALNPAAFNVHYLSYTLHQDIARLHFDFADAPSLQLVLQNLENLKMVIDGMKKGNGGVAAATADAGVLHSSSSKEAPPPAPNMSTIRLTEREKRHMSRAFFSSCSTGISEDLRKKITSTDFNNWPHDNKVLLLCIRQMFIDLQLLDTLKLKREPEVLEKWLLAVYCSYNHVPFHNFKHCFMVTQMMYAILCTTQLHAALHKLDVLSLLVAAICHDLDHPGFNNEYQVNRRTVLALRYNDMHVLENHHSAKAAELLLDSERNIFRNLSSGELRTVREAMAACILATDMAEHHKIVNNFKEIVDKGALDLGKKDHKYLLMRILIKTSDISNESRPMVCAERWLNCLIEEFFAQGDVERKQGLPSSPLTDRRLANKANNQVYFLKTYIQPLLEALCKFFPVLEKHLHTPVKSKLEFYKKLQKQQPQQGVGDQ